MENKNTQFILVAIGLVIIITGAILLPRLSDDSTANTANSDNIESEIETQNSNVEAEQNQETDDSETTNKTEMESDKYVETADTNYLPYTKERLSLAADNDVILFFKASWCPSCNALDKNILENLTNIPEDVYILTVNYDDISGATSEEKELRDRNKVSYQHTLLLVDTDGNKQRELVSAFTLSQLLGDLNN